MLGAATSAASTGSAVYKRGKLNASWMASFDQVVAAGETAFDDLGLTVTRSAGDAAKGHWSVIAVNEDRDTVRLTIDRKTDRLTEFQIDVGWLGREPTARLVLKRMTVAINLSAAQDGDDEAIRSPTSALD